ncbi:hypothetical protein [Halorussus halophilus]|uniref:hypothetical protein n=1 Tax=Halorussus halophilus TaxID=2650975 RepID=UPI001300E0BA|nr:hypothetical protein [Halorussus halophilus]
MVENNVTVCFDCMEWRPETEVARKIETAKRLRNASRGVNTLYARKLLKTGIEKTRLFVFAGRALFVRRLTVGLTALVVVLTAILSVVALVGTLFVSVETGVQWTLTVSNSLRTTGAYLRTRSWLLVAALATAYALHVAEREREYLLGVQRERRRGGGRDLPNYRDYKYPRWQLLVAFSILTSIGALDWFALSVGLRDGSRVGASLLWLTGSIGVAVALRAALREDRDASGFAVRPTPWVGVSRLALALGSVEIATTFSSRTFLPEALTQTGFALVPLVGVGYVLRRTIERHTGWRPYLPYFTRTLISAPRDDPPREQHDPEYPEENDSDL